MDSGQSELISVKKLFYKELSDVRLQMKEFRTQLLLLVDDNRKLTKELKENIQYRISVTDMVDNIALLESNLHEVNEAKKASTRLSTQENGEERKMDNVQDNELERRITDVQEHYRKGIGILSKELHKAQNDLKNAKLELQRKSDELEKSNALFKKCQNALSDSEKKIVEYKGKERELKEKFLLLESDLSKNRRQLNAKHEESDDLKNSNGKLLSINADLKKENNELNKLLLIIKKDARASLLAAEEAIFQKSELVLKEEYSQKRIKVLTTSIDDNVRNVILKFKDEAQRVIDKHAKEKEAFTNEIQRLQDETNEKQNELEKIRRESERIGSMVESLRKENMENCIPYSVYYELSERFTVCERARENAIFQQTISENKLKDVTESTSHDIDFYKLETKCANENVKHLKKALDDILPERDTMSEEIKEKRSECNSLKNEVQILKQLLQKEVDDLKEEMSIKTEALSVQLKTVGETYMKRIKELEELLSNQQAISRKWKNVALSINSKDVPRT